MRNWAGGGPPLFLERIPGENVGRNVQRQEAWTERKSPVELRIPNFIREVIEQVAFSAREDKRVDKRSGVSQRLPISAMENVISNAERRSLRGREPVAVPRILDIYSALPAVTGKLELEYEGELKGGDTVARELIRTAVGNPRGRESPSVRRDGTSPAFAAAP